MSKTPPASVLSLAQLLEQQSPAPPPCLVEPGLLPMQGILFVGGEPKVGKSLLVANLALSLAAGSDRLGFPVPAPRRVLVCQFELPIPQFVSRLATMRRAMGNAADQNLFVDTRATGNLLSAPQGLQHFLAAARAAAAEIIILDPLYSTHDQDENDTRAMAALCQSLLRLREASRAALIVVHHVRKSIGRYESDSLIVDTIEVNTKIALDGFGTPHTEKLHVIERFHLIEGGNVLEANIHVEDPGAFTMPWDAIQRFRQYEAAVRKVPIERIAQLASAAEGPMSELICAENRNSFFASQPGLPVPQAVAPDF